MPGIWTDLFGGAPYIMVGDMAGLASANPQPSWAGWRVPLTIGPNGQLVGSAQVGGLGVPTPCIGDAINWFVSGTALPDTTISSAMLFVDSQAGINQFTVPGLISSDGSAGPILVDFHASGAQTGPPMVPGYYRYSIVWADSNGNIQTVVNGAWLKLDASLAV